MLKQKDKNNNEMGLMAVFVSHNTICSFSLSHITRQSADEQVKGEG